MTHNSKQEVARNELLRLLKGLEFYRAWRISGINAANGEVRQEDLNEIVEPSTAFLGYFDNAGDRYGEILQLIREWYSHTYSDLCNLANTGDEAVSSEIRSFLKEFRNEVGFEFQSEAGLVAKTVRKVLKSGKITNERDFFILKELENSVDQALLKGSEFDAVSNMLRHFENH